MQVPKGREADYTLNEHLANKAIDYIHQQKSITPDRPFFVYYAPGATHAPHHVPKAWLAKFRGQFDGGWDRYREATSQRQKQLGVIPADTKLTPRPPEIPAWDALSDSQRTVAARLMEAFAAYTAQTDHEVGRVIDAVTAIGQQDNTLILWEIGDNGASMEGSLYGLFNEMVAARRRAGRSRLHPGPPRRNRRPERVQPLPGRLGVGDEHAVSVGKAGRLAPRRRSQPAGHLVARAHQGQGGRAQPVPSPDRRRADDPGSRGDPRAGRGQRRDPEADRGGEPGVLLRRPAGEKPAQDAVLRDVRQPGALRRRLDRHVPPRAFALGERRLGRLRQGRLAALSPRIGFQRSQRRRRASIRSGSGTSRTCSGSRPPSTTSSLSTIVSSSGPTRRRVPA